MTLEIPDIERVVRSLNDFTGKSVLITGAAGQLGGTFCAGFKAAGATVLASDISSTGVDRTICDAFYEMDIASLESVQSRFAELCDAFGPLDILVNNAGTAVFEHFDDRTEDDLDEVFDVNVKGTFWCTREFAKLPERMGTRIVNIASLHGVVSPDPRVYTDLARASPEIYGITKAGIVQMTKYFAVHLADRGIQVNAVSPGGVFNPKKPQGEDFRKHYAHRCPMSRMAHQEEIASGVLYLASDAARYVNGHNLVIDGGYTAW